jgi:RNA-directed DNA polymerase
VKRWLCAPLENREGVKVARTRGTPQGGVVSPILANLFLHYALDAWIRKEFAGIAFCRYADDGILHFNSEKQAKFAMERLTQRLQECGLEIHPAKSRIIYCKDISRKGKYEVISFDFLGYTFRPRSCINKRSKIYPNFLPAISNNSKKAINQEIRSWHIQLKNNKSLLDISKMFNPILTGWYNYYGRFYPSRMAGILRNFNEYLVRWVRRKFKRFAWHKRKARWYLNRIANANQHLFIHWKLGILPGSKMVGAV